MKKENFTTGHNHNIAHRWHLHYWLDAGRHLVHHLLQRLRRDVRQSRPDRNVANWHHSQLSDRPQVLPRPHHLHG